MSEKLYKVIAKLEATKSAFKSAQVAEAREMLVEVLNDPSYSPDELAWATEAIGYEMTGKLAYSEVMAICDILNGHMATSADIRYGGQMLAASIEDGCALEGLDKKWQIDGKALAEKLKGLTDPQAWWVGHQARVWWHTVSSGDGAPEEEYTRKLFRVAKE